MHLLQFGAFGIAGRYTQIGNVIWSYLSYFFADPNSEKRFLHQKSDGDYLQYRIYLMEILEYCHKL
jgi:hypothetical protein